METIRSSLAGLVLMVLTALCVPSALAAVEMGVVTAVQGQAFVTSIGGPKRVLSQGSVIYEGDVIETIADPVALRERLPGNSLRITTADEARWSLVRSSKLEVKYYQRVDEGARKAGARYRVHYGSLFYESGNLKSKAVVLLDDATLTPMGTALRFETVAGVTLGKVMDGEVSYIRADGTTGIIRDGEYVLRDASGKVTVYPSAQAARADLLQALELAVAAGQMVGTQAGNYPGVDGQLDAVSLEAFAESIVADVANNTALTDSTSLDGDSAILDFVDEQPVLLPPVEDDGSNDASPSR